MQARGAAAHRAELVGALSGKFIEIGYGPDGMFPHDPGAATSALAVEPTRICGRSPIRPGPALAHVIGSTTIG